jgi:hypothetical protein
LLPGYSISFDRKKQYLQSKLHAAPEGLTNKWNPGGVCGEAFRKGGILVSLVLFMIDQ